jgi:hypothetical protein
VEADQLNKEMMRSRPSIAAPTVRNNNKTSNQLITTKIFSIPDKQARGEALSLLARLEKNPFIEWDDMGNVQLYGSDLGGANIADLVRYAVYPKNPRNARRNAIPPAHWNEFLAAIQRMPQTGSGYKRRKCPIHHY